MKLIGIRAQNYGPIKDITLDLDYKGITTIFGLNKDASSGTENYTNAAGKSLLMSVYPEMIWAKPPSGKDKTKHVCTLSQKWRSDSGKVFEFIKTYGKGKKIQILRDGEDLNNRTLDWAQKKMQGLVGGSEEDFYTSRFIDSTIPHPLIVGSAAVRQEYFVKLFNLQNVDAVRSLLNVELREVQKAAASYREIRDLFDEQKARAGSLKDYEPNKELLAELQVRHKKLTKQLNSQQIIRSLLQFEDTNSKLLKRFKALTNVDDFEADYSATKKRVRDLERAVESAEVWTVYKIERRQWKERTVKLTADLEALGFSYDDADRIKKKARASRDAQVELGVIQDRIEKVKKAREGLDTTPVEEPKRSAKEIRQGLDKVENELDHARKFHEGLCPTCGANVKARSKDEIKADIKLWRKRLEGLDAYTEYQEAAARDKELRTELRDLRAREEEAQKASSEKYEKASRVLAKFEDAPERPEGDPVDVDKARTDLEEARERLAKFKQFHEVLDTIADVLAITDEARAEVESFETLADKVQKMNLRIVELSARVVAQSEARKSLRALAEKGQALKEKAEDEKILKALIAAYSKKGLKRALIQSYSKRLEQQVNKLSRLFFNEDLAFEFAFENEMQVLVHRKVGKVVKTTDVRRLSGAEKRMFTLVLVASSITLLPKNKRPHEVVFDEPEANLGPEALQTFLKVLPILNKIIPHIILVTPRPELHVEGARVLTVVKHRGVSTLVEKKNDASESLRNPNADAVPSKRAAKKSKR